MVSTEVLDLVFNEITEISTTDDINTGFIEIDASLENNIKPYFITIGARPSMGKTAFSTTILLNLLEDNKNCLVFSNEMCEKSYIRRLVAQIGNFCLSSFRDKRTMNDMKKLKIKKALDKISKYKLTINDRYVDVDDIQEQIEAIRPDYVFIDNIHMLAEKITAKSLKRLKQIAQDDDCPIFALSGLTRAPENRKDKIPMLSDLIESKNLTNISDIVMFLYRYSYYFGPDPKDPDNDKAEVIIAKNKGGACLIVPLIFDPNTTKFSDSTYHDVFEDYDTI